MHKLKSHAWEINLWRSKSCASWSPTCCLMRGLLKPWHISSAPQMKNHVVSPSCELCLLFLASSSHSTCPQRYLTLSFVPGVYQSRGSRNLLMHSSPWWEYRTLFPLSKHYLIWSLTIIMWAFIVMTSQLEPLTLEHHKGVSEKALSTNGSYRNRMWKYKFSITQSNHLLRMNKLINCHL